MKNLTTRLAKLTIGHPERVATAHAVLTDLGITSPYDLAGRNVLTGREYDAAIKALAIVLDRSDDDVLGTVINYREA